MIQDIIKENEAVTPVSREMEGLREYFPQCFNNEGRFDIEKFREAIEPQVDVTREGRSYDFLGKSYARMLSSLDTTTVIRPDVEHNSKPENVNSENIYISGDNLDALHHLVKSYAGQVKCIYIDPPYNTGSDGFVYNDKFKFTAEDLEKKLSISPDEAEKIIAMTSGHRASHAAWLTFMMPRLQLARDLLSKDGVIFISIDDNEQANLKTICDYIYGEDNFLANLTRRTKSGGGSAADAFAVENDYILAYARDAERLGSLYIPYTEEYLKRYKEEDEIGKFFWDTMSRSCTGTKPYQIEAPDGTMLEGNWFKSEKTYLTEKEAGDTRIIKKPDGTWSVQFKQRIAEGKKLRSILIEEFIREDLLGNDFKSTQEDLEKLEMGGLFSNPKTVFLLSYLLQLISGDGNYIVDFFSGSATTAEAVLRSNLSFSKNNHFIMVQLPENLDESFNRMTGTTKTTLERDLNFLEDNHYPHTLDYIGFERIKRASKKIKEENPEFAGDLGFKHYTLEEVPENTLDKLETFDPNVLLTTDDTLNLFGRETVLTTWLVQDGYGLNAKTQDVKLDNYHATLCGNHLYMTDSGFTEDDMVALIDLYQKEPSFCPDCIVLFGYSFSHNAKDMLEKNKPTVDLVKDIKLIIDVRY
jgi:adenine specific DNA methylase Mod